MKVAHIRLCERKMESVSFAPTGQNAVVVPLEAQWNQERPEETCIALHLD